MTEVVVLSPLSVALSNPEICDEFLWSAMEEENRALEREERRWESVNAPIAFLEALIQSLMPSNWGNTLAGTVPPAYREHVRRGHSPVETICRPSPGTAALLNQRGRLGVAVQRAMDHFGFRVGQFAQIVLTLIEVANMVPVISGMAVSAANSSGRVLANSTRSTRLVGRSGGRSSPLHSADRSDGPRTRISSRRGVPVEITEIGAGDLQAGIRLQQGANIRVTAVDPIDPPTAALARLRNSGGRFQRGTAADVPSGSADHVVSYFPYPIEGQGGTFTHIGEHGASNTLNMVNHGLRILRRGGVLTLVTESESTALHFAASANRAGSRSVVTHPVSAASAAPGATGDGLPNFSPNGTQVYLVHIYKR